MADGLKKTGTRKLTISLEFCKFHRSELLFGLLMHASTGSWSKTFIKSCVLRLSDKENLQILSKRATSGYNNYES